MEENTWLKEALEKIAEVLIEENYAEINTKTKDQIKELYKTAGIDIKAISIELKLNIYH